MPAVPVTRNRVVEVLKRRKRGLTTGEICKLIPEIQPRTIMSSINAARRLKGDKRVLFVSRWIRNLGNGGLMTPVFGAGSQEDVEKPKVNVRKEAYTRYNTKRYARQREERHSQRLKQIEEETAQRLKKSKDPGERAILMMVRPPLPIELDTSARTRYRAAVRLARD
jgi:hypothetical protein